MKDRDLLKGLEFIDAELIEAADRIPEKRNKVEVIGWYVAALGMAALIAIVMTIAYKWGATGSGDIHIHNPERPTVQQPVYPTAPTNMHTEPTQQTQPKEPISMGAVSYLTLDVNPSIHFSVRNGVVTGFVAKNQDGEYLLHETNLAGMALQDAISLVVDRLIEQGYLESKQQTPVMLLSARGGEQANELLRTAVTAASNELTENQIASFIVTKEVNDPEAEKLARTCDVSVGKMQYILDILKGGADLSLGEASVWSLVELFRIDVEDRTVEPAYKPGGYEDYAEKILFVSGHENYVP